MNWKKVAVVLVVVIATVIIIGIPDSQQLVWQADIQAIPSSQIECINQSPDSACLVIENSLTASQQLTIPSACSATMSLSEFTEGQQITTKLLQQDSSIITRCWKVDFGPGSISSEIAPIERSPESDIILPINTYSNIRNTIRFTNPTQIENSSFVYPEVSIFSKTGERVATPTLVNVTASASTVIDLSEQVGPDFQGYVRLASNSNLSPRVVRLSGTEAVAVITAEATTATTTSSTPSMPPTAIATGIPTIPTAVPTETATSLPTIATAIPTSPATVIPTIPTAVLTSPPTGIPTIPTAVPTSPPTVIPTIPTAIATETATSLPTIPTAIPTSPPTGIPTIPTAVPTSPPTGIPTVPTAVATETVTILPTVPVTITATRTNTPSSTTTTTSTSTTTSTTIPMGKSYKCDERRCVLKRDDSGLPPCQTSDGGPDHDVCGSSVCEEYLGNYTCARTGKIGPSNCDDGMGGKDNKKCGHYICQDFACKHRPYTEKGEDCALTNSAGEELGGDSSICGTVVCDEEKNSCTKPAAKDTTLPVCVTYIHLDGGGLSTNYDHEKCRKRHNVCMVSSGIGICSMEPLNVYGKACTEPDKICTFSGTCSDDHLSCVKPSTKDGPGCISDGDCLVNTVE